MYDSTQNQVSVERKEILTGRYARFQESLEAGQEVIRVFDPLNQRQKDELTLIRDVSKDLQKKKEEDIQKAAQAQAEEAESKKEIETVVKEETVESATKEDA